MRQDKYILNDQGQPEPCDDLFRWARWFETADRHVSQDYDEADGERRVRVSTVFLGLDHNFFGEGPPILWETLVIGGVLDGEMARYSSLEAALLGHQRMCQRVNETISR